MLKDLYRIPNHVERAISLLVSQFSNSPKLKGLLAVFMQQIQDLQNAAEDLYYYRSLTDNPAFYAVGAQLDGLGQILNLPRLQGESDNDYRIRLRFRSFLIFSSGTPEQIMYILLVNSQATFVQYYDIFPAAYQMLTNGGAQFQDNTGLPPEEQVNHNFISKLLWQSSPAAVQFVPVTATYGVPIVFGFASDFEEAPLYVNTETETDIPLISNPTDFQYYVNTGQNNDDIGEGGFADITAYSILGLDDNGVLELDDGGNLLLFSNEGDYDTPGAGQYAEMLYYEE